MTAVAERSTVEILRAARERISDPERWTTEAYARDRDGSGTEPQQADAVCWCAVGAFLAEQGLAPRVGDDPHRSNPVLDLLIEAAGHRPVAAVNDKDGHAAVLALYDRAIELAEASK